MVNPVPWLHRKLLHTAWGAPSPWKLPRPLPVEGANSREGRGWSPPSTPAFASPRAAQAAFRVPSPSRVSAKQKASKAPTPISLTTRLLPGLCSDLACEAEAVSQGLPYLAAVEDKGKKCTYKIERSNKINSNKIPKADYCSTRLLPTPADGRGRAQKSLGTAESSSIALVPRLSLGEVSAYASQPQP